MASAIEPCPECSEPLQHLLMDEHGGVYWRCSRSGYHWVCFAHSWYRDHEWRRFVAGELAVLRRGPGNAKPQAIPNPLRARKR